MRKTVLTFCISALGLVGSAAQTPVPVVVAPPPGSYGSNRPTPAADLPRFDLDFNGGNPEQFVEAIRSSLKGPLNVVLPNNQNEVHIPPLKMRQVNVSELFNALGRVSTRSVAYQIGYTDYTAPGPQYSVPGQSMNRRSTVSTYNEQYSFSTEPPITQNSIWYLVISSRPQTSENKVCRYYQLAPYLKNLKIDDVTTAIQAGWRMLGVSPAPELNFHKDTSLLIAVGDQQKLDIIDAVLAELAKAPQVIEVKAGPAPANVNKAQ